MANEIGDAKAGLRARLETIPGLRVLDHPPGAVNELPAAVVSLHSRQGSRTLGGGGFEGRMRVTLLVASASANEAYAALDRFIDPSGPHSVEAAVDGDNTWAARSTTGGSRRSRTSAPGSCGAANTSRRTSCSSSGRVVDSG